MKRSLRMILTCLCCVLAMGAQAQDAPHWSVNMHDYQYDMTAYVTLVVDNEVVTDLSGYEVAAFCGTDCRGVATVETVTSGGQQKSYAYLRIRSNEAQGETITFKVYDKTYERELGVENTTLTFKSLDVQGLPSDPLQLQVLANQYTSTFVLGNGQDNVVKTQDYNSQLSAPENLVKTGYTFNGWSPEVPATVPVGDQTYTAQWQINQYTMTFKLGNGQDDIVKTQDYGTTLEAPANLVKTGYTFTGWDTEVPGTVPAGDKTFTAQWQVNQYTMTFVLGNGQDDIVKTQDYDSALEAPAAPQREGYTFKGWDAEIPSKIPADNKTFTAQWQVNQYTSTFVLGNGQDNVVKTQDYNSQLSAPENLAKTGYTFNGWEPAVPATVPVGDQTYTAQWQINQYTMTFQLGNGQDDIEKTQDYDTNLEVPADPQREGYTFTGWDAEIPAKMPADNKTFTAQWQVNQYTMTFVLGNGQDNVVKTQDYGTTLEAPVNLVKTGYTFTGWDVEVPTTVPAGDKTFTAQWQINQYTMTFKLGNGQDDIVKTQDYDSALEAPAAPQREGYTFTGWDAEIPAKMPAENKTFTAQWQVNKYKVKFVAEGQTVKEGQVEYGAAIEKPADPQKTGYVFIGWSPEVPATMPAADQTFTAQFALNPYTMTFVLGNGEDDIVKTQECGSELTAPADPQREGYTFTGWSPVVPATIPAGDQTFTAQWQINQYTMTFVLGNGEDNVVKTQDYGTALEAPANLVKTGYTFTGWDVEVPTTVPAGDKTFTAQWQVNQYAIIYMVNGQEWARDLMDFGAAITLREYTPAAGETFGGWTFDGGQSFEVMPAHDVTVIGAITTFIENALKNTGTVSVYDVRGRMLYRDLPVSKLRKVLRAGVYIINGYTVVLK